MDANLGTRCIAFCCTVDDLVPEPPANGRCVVTDARVLTLCVARARRGIPSDRRCLKVTAKRLGHLCPEVPADPGYFKRAGAWRARPRG
jgi:hypothetical protein